MTDAVDQEIDAIRAVLAALDPLSDAARQSVLDYVTRRLNIGGSGGSPRPLGPGSSAGASPPSAAGPGGVVHIEAFKNEKKPRSANEMAAIVAYYLANLAPLDQRKTTITTSDIETQFKIAKFPLPEQVRVTLQNARNAGYFDPAGEGAFKLNAVGHNLVAHNMPRGEGGGRKRKAKRSSGRPAKKPAK